MEERVEASVQDCEVCSHPFDGRERRPRCIPCGHTLCSQCISDNLLENLFLCPYCRAEFQVKESTDFPVNYAVEKLIQKLVGGEFPVTKELPESPVDPSTAISKKLRSHIKALNMDIEVLIASSHKVRSHLEEYQSLLKEWKEYYQTMVKSTQKEFGRVSEALKEEEKKKQKLEMVRENLALASHDVLPVFEEALKCYDALDQWTQETQKSFPDNELFKKVLILQEGAQEALQTLLAYEGMDSAVADDKESHTPELTETLSLEVDASLSSNLETACDSSSSSELVLKTIREKLKRALENVTVLKETSKASKQSDEVVDQREPPATLLGNKTQVGMASVITGKSVWTMTLARQMIEAEKVFAVQSYEGQQRYAKISFKNHKLCLHVLLEKTPPLDAIIVQHDDMMTLMKSYSSRAFLEFGTDAESFGCVYISLPTDTKRAQNFTVLCSGEKGKSYQNTNVLHVNNNYYKNPEYIRCGDYEYNNGEGGRELVLGAGEEELEEKDVWETGSVIGYKRATNTAAQFYIVTNRMEKESDCYLIGNVTAGYACIMNAINTYTKIRLVRITDCGHVLPG